MLFETNINPPLLPCMMIIDRKHGDSSVATSRLLLTLSISIDLGSHVRKPFGHVIGKFLSVVPMGGLNKSWSTIVLLLALVVLSTFRVNNANLLRHRVREGPAADAEDDTKGGDASGESGASAPSKNSSKFKNVRAHIHTDCTGKDCKSHALYNNITELEEELGPGVKHALEVKCGAKSGKPCKVKALKPKKTPKELQELKKVKNLARIDALMKKVKRKKLNEHIMKKMPKLMVAVKAAIKEYNIGMIRKAAKIVKKRSSKEQTVLDDIALKLKTLAAVKTDEPSGPSGPDGIDWEDEDEDEDPSAMPVDKRINKLEDWAMDKLQKRYNDLKNGASGASGGAGLLEKLPLRERIKVLEKRIKNRVLKRVRVLERMQHKELVKRIAKLEKRKAKILGLNVKTPNKPGIFSKHHGPGFKDDEEEKDSTDSKAAGNNMSPYEDGKDANGNTPKEAEEAATEESTDESGGTGPAKKIKVVDDSDSPVYKLTGKEPTSEGDPKTKAGLCANGPCQKKTTTPDGKPIWHRVAELDHGAMPDIIDFADPNMPTQKKKYGKFVAEDDMSGSSGPAEGEAETHKKPKLVSLEDIKEGHKEKPEEMKEITISKASPPEEPEETFQDGYTLRSTWNQDHAPMKSPGVYTKALADQDKKAAAAKTVGTEDSKLKSQ